MNEVKFIEYKATPGEKHMGLATLLVNGIIFLRYKVNAGKNGGFYLNPASYKVTECGCDSYVSAFMVESTFLKESIETCAKTNISRVLSSQPSAFAQATTSSQPSPQQAYNNPNGLNLGTQVASTQTIQEPTGAYLDSCPF